MNFLAYVFQNTPFLRTVEFKMATRCNLLSLSASHDNDSQGVKELPCHYYHIRMNAMTFIVKLVYKNPYILS